MAKFGNFSIFETWQPCDTTHLCPFYPECYVTHSNFDKNKQQEFKLMNKINSFIWHQMNQFPIYF